METRDKNKKQNKQDSQYSQDSQDPQGSQEYPKEDVPVSIRLSDGSTINGNINILGYNRLSEGVLSNKNRFLIVYDAILNGIGGHGLMINKDHIIFIAMPDVK